MAPVRPIRLAQGGMARDGSLLAFFKSNKQVEPDVREEPVCILSSSPVKEAPPVHLDLTSEEPTTLIGESITAGIAVAKPAKRHSFFTRFDDVSAVSKKNKPVQKNKTAVMAPMFPKHLGSVPQGTSIPFHLPFPIKPVNHRRIMKEYSLE